MSSATPSIGTLLALARQRRLWPEVDPQAAPAEQSLSAEPPAGTPAETELRLATEALLQEAARALGPRLGAAAPLFELLAALLHSGGRANLEAAWAVLDDLEDQLEALCR